VRAGGICALERIGKDPAPDRPAVVYVLGAFVRHRSKEEREAGKEPAEDVCTALRAIRRLAPMTDVVINLGGADLRNANLRFMRGVRPIIRGADLTGASLPEDREAPAEPPGLQPPSPRDGDDLYTARRNGYELRTCGAPRC
jgi:hypothetical protein